MKTGYMEYDTTTYGSAEIVEIAAGGIFVVSNDCDGKEGFWAMWTRQGKAYWLDYDKVLDKLNEIIKAVNRLEKKVS